MTKPPFEQIIRKIMEFQAVRPRLVGSLHCEWMRIQEDKKSLPKKVRKFL